MIELPFSLQEVEVMAWLVLTGASFYFTRYVIYTIVLKVFSCREIGTVPLVFLTLRVALSLMSLVSAFVHRIKTEGSDDTFVHLAYNMLSLCLNTQQKFVVAKSSMQYCVHFIAQTAVVMN